MNHHYRRSIHSDLSKYENLMNVRGRCITRPPPTHIREFILRTKQKRQTNFNGFIFTLARWLLNTWLPIGQSNNDGIYRPIRKTSLGSTSVLLDLTWMARSVYKINPSISELAEAVALWFRMNEMATGRRHRPGRRHGLFSKLCIHLMAKKYHHWYVFANMWENPMSLLCVAYFYRII